MTRRNQFCFWAVTVTLLALLAIGPTAVQSQEPENCFNSLVGHVRVMTPTLNKDDSPLTDLKKIVVIVIYEGTTAEIEVGSLLTTEIGVYVLVPSVLPQPGKFRAFAIAVDTCENESDLSAPSQVARVKLTGPVACSEVEWVE